MCFLQKGQKKMKTIEKHVEKLYTSMKTRCNGELGEGHDSYTENNIFCMFKSAEDLYGYIINALGTDPRDLECHRIDNAGHYEPGNIVFLTKMEHGQEHKGTGLADFSNPKQEHHTSLSHGKERNMSEFEESVLRACHHEFDGLSQAEAAESLGVSPATISRTLTNLEERAKTCTPIRCMFPILTRQQFKIFDCLTNLGLSTEETAEELGLDSVNTVHSTVSKLRKKGMDISKRGYTPKAVSYAPYMDGQVKEKF
jgi:transposase